MDSKLSVLARFGYDGTSDIAKQGKFYSLARFAMRYYTQGGFYNDGTPPVFKRGVLGFDAANNEVLVSLACDLTQFPAPPICFSFNESTDTLTSFYPVQPINMASFLDRVILINPQQPNEVWLHDAGRYGEWFGQFYNSALKYVVRENYPITKIFDNMQIDVNPSGVVNIGSVFFEPGDGTAQVSIDGDSRRKYRLQRLEIPMRSANAGNGNRVVGQYCLVGIEVKTDTNNVATTITSCSTIYRFAAKV
jgi:hypothetical protein